MLLKGQINEGLKLTIGLNTLETGELVKSSFGVAIGKKT